MRTGTARVAARGSRLCVATSAINSRTWSELSWGGKQADFARVCFCTRKRQQASEALDSARAKAGTVLNFIPAFSYFSTEAITCIVISRLSGILPLPQIPKSGLVLCWGHVQAHKDGSISATRCRAGLAGSLYASGRWPVGARERVVLKNTVFGV